MWYAKPYGAYAIDSPEARANALSISYVLTGKHWSGKSVCALLGNGAGESGLNPWRWQSDYVPSFAEFSVWTAEQAQAHGYGLFQFTPASRYINAENAVKYDGNGYSPNFSNIYGRPTDGNAQTLYFADTAQSSWLHGLYNYYAPSFSAIGVDISRWYYTTYNNFIRGTDNNHRALSLADLVGVFELCYERPSAEYAASSYAQRVQNAEYWLPVLNLQKKTKWIYYMKARRN